MSLSTEDIARRLDEGHRRARQRRTAPLPRDTQTPPGPSAWEFLLPVALGRPRQHTVLASVRERFGRIGYLRAVGHHQYLLTEPEDVRELLVERASTTRKTPRLELVRPLLGDGLLPADGATHMRSRRMVQPAFSPAALRGYQATIVDCIDERSQEWHQRSSPRVDLAHEMSTLTLTVVARTMLSTDLDNEAADNFSEALWSILSSVPRVLTPWGELLTRLPTKRRRELIEALAQLEAVVSRVIATRREQLAAGERPQDALGMLMESRDEEGGLSELQLRDEILVLLLAGHETTAAVLTYSFLELAKHPAVKRWAAQEWSDVQVIDRLRSGDLAAAPRTRAIVTETLRLHPPVWLLPRQTGEPMRLQGFDVPEGALVNACPYVQHRDERAWAEPNDWLPQRWIDSAGGFQDRQPSGSYFPFGLGRRTCMGARFAVIEAVTALAVLSSQWHVIPLPPLDKRELPGLTLRPAEAVQAVLRPTGRD